MTLDDLSRWARGNGLEIVLIATGAVLLARLVRWTANRLVSRSVRREAAREEGVVASEQSKHERALIQVVAWTTVVLLYVVTALVIIERLNVPLTSLVAPATVAGVALGFGAQRVVQDLLSGFFLFAERQYGFGDVIRISPPGTSVGITGTVEEVTLRTTTMRTVNGEVVVIPNGEIRQVTNLSKDWARVVLDIPLPLGTDVSLVTRLLQEISASMATDAEWSEMLLDPPSVMGVENLEVDFLNLRFVARTLPGRQWEVARELRGRIAGALREAGIVIPPSLLATTAHTASTPT